LSFRVEIFHQPVRHDTPRNIRYADRTVVKVSTQRAPPDAFLPRSMPIGTSIKKQRWHLDYEKNGYHVDDFPIYFYALVMGGASACLIWSLLSWRHQKRLE
jgi:hypothetical protein